MKTRFRQQLRKVLADISPEQARAQSGSACRLLLDLPEYQSAEVVMIFFPLPGEIDTTSLALRAWQQGKRVLAPKLGWEQRRMMAIEIQSLTREVAWTSLGHREPFSGSPVPPAQIDLVLVPGLGFDACGNRLGRGRGFYDRFLSNPQCDSAACGLAFEQQFVDQLPAGPLDSPVDLLVTDVRVRRFNQ